MRSQTTKKLVALNSVTFIMVFGNSLLIPGFPQIRAALDITFFQVSLLITYYSVAAGIFIPIFGYISDHVKRKWVIIAALVLYGLGGTLIAILALGGGEGIFSYVLAGRVLQGIGAAGMSPIAMALVGDIFTTEERAKALGTIEFTNIVGKVISPILGAALVLISWFVPFFVFGAFVIPVLVAILFLIKEPESKKGTPFKKYFADIKKIFTDRGKFLWLSYLGGSLSFLILFGVLAFLSDLMEQRYDITGILKGAVLAVPVTAWAASSFYSGFHLENNTHQLKYFIMTGLSLLGVATALFPHVENLYLFLTVVAVMGLGGGLIIPSLTILVTNSAPTEERGGIVSLYGSVRFFGVALGPPLYSFLSDIREGIPFWSAGVVALVLFVFFLRLNNQEVIDLCQKKEE